MEGYMKKASLGALLATLSVGAYADGYYKDAAPQSNDGGSWYVGAQAGYDMYMADQNITEVGAPGDAANPNLAANGYAGALFAGYGYHFNLFYLGAEGYLATSGADTSWTATLDAANSFTSSFNVNSSAGLNLLPGISLNDSTTGFVKLGYNWVNVEQKDTGAGNSGSNSSTVSGFSYGLGVETMLTRSWGVRLDYTYFDLGSINHTVAGEVNSKLDLSNNQFMLGIAYHIV